jgi:hypothetical protein
MKHLFLQYFWLEKTRNSITNILKFLLAKEGLATARGRRTIRLPLLTLTLLDWSIALGRAGLGGLGFCGQGDGKPADVLTY